MDQRTNGPMNQWTNGPMLQWTNGPMVQWSTGPEVAERLIGETLVTLWKEKGYIERHECSKSQKVGALDIY